MQPPKEVQSTAPSLPSKHEAHYEGLLRRNPKMTLDFTRRECCESNSRHAYSIPDWYEGGHYFVNECQTCGKEWWMDETELGLVALDWEE